ncbi:MAG: hypothetical protein GY948_08840 [Alphaproteobacteria bacterium]|nr:hypothetical protein [Alphaproteobacteria bacterium]
MSTDTSRPTGKKSITELQATVRTIEKAITLSRANNHRFLTYLLEMARLEATNLAGSQKP